MTRRLALKISRRRNTVLGFIGVNGALIKTTPEKICQMKTENSATKELLETLPT